MKILFLTYVRNPSYHKPEEWLSRISPSLGVMEQLALDARVMNIHSIGYRGEVTSGKVEHYFFYLGRAEAAIPLLLHRFVKGLDPDAVIIRGLIFPLQALLLRWQLGNGVIIMAQHHAEKPLKGYKKFIQILADRYISKYFFASKEHGKRWVEAGLIKDESKVVEAMVNSSTFSAMSKTAARNVSGISGEKVYLWVGGLDKNKDPITLVEAFAKFAVNHPGVRLYVIFQDNGLLREVESMAKGSPQIKLVGRIDHNDLLHWYNGADFIVSTSYYEGAGIAVCEGMSCGCIPVLSDIPSFRWMSSQGKIGLLFEPGNSMALYAALERSLEMELVPERNAVLKHYQDLLSPEANAKKILSVITSFRLSS